MVTTMFSRPELGQSFWREHQFVESWEASDHMTVVTTDLHGLFDAKPNQLYDPVTLATAVHRDLIAPAHLFVVNTVSHLQMGR